MTDQELRDLVASLAASQKETDRQIKQVNKQLGELGNNFGSFAEGLALPALEKVLRHRFGVNDVSPGRKFFLNGETLEMDVFGYDNTGALKDAYVVEIKSHLKPDAINQILETMAKLPRFFPAMKDRKIYGIIAAVKIPANLRTEVLKQGLYLAQISDETFKLLVPPKFKPTDFGPTAQRNGAGNGHSKKKAR